MDAKRFGGPGETTIVHDLDEYTHTLDDVHIAPQKVLLNTVASTNSDLAKRDISRCWR
ncbi:hypothetical protein D3C84_1305710 [compost metagenome]